MELHILDCSQYIHAGSYANTTISRGVREDNGEYQENWAPIGGVRFLINRAAELCKDGSIVIPVFDKTPNIKREMYKAAFGDEFGYKGNRKTPDPMRAVSIQKDYAYIIMEKIGYPVQAAQDYESDDVIYTLVQMYKNDFESIHVHSSDSDLYFLVGGNVMMDTVGPNIGKVITQANYPNVVDKDGWCPYNVHHIRKLCNGDHSDNIPGIGSDWMPRLDSVIPADKLAYLGDLEVCREFLKDAVDKYPTAPNAHMLLKTFNILVPLVVPEHLINDVEPAIDWDKQRYFVHGWKPDEDHWGFEDDLTEYIDSYYR